jgi:hypothetical protein
MDAVCKAIDGWVLVPSVLTRSPGDSCTYHRLIHRVHIEQPQLQAGDEAELRWLISPRHLLLAQVYLRAQTVAQQRLDAHPSNANVTSQRAAYHGEF